MAVRAISLDPPFRPAVPDDAPALVDFIDYASAGMALIAWAQAVGPGSGDPAGIRPRDRAWRSKQYVLSQRRRR